LTLHAPTGISTAKGLTIAGEQWPNELTANGVRFALGSNQRGAANI
jgi:hypothetical protein